MEIFIYAFALGGFAGVALYGAILAVFHFAENLRSLREEVAELKRDNLKLSRKNKALRELIR